ncbi:sigma 54-interacting transcriptional regulator [Thermoactinomyces intermedius]|jgi:transcriptional regulator of aroF, aroG, tyrA and aromatic amino acid transport|uniref:HTH-type transcriptional regulatory protein TyrR n=1 Tax=Thermoactinomyces intermedius TaxID=2024 RepID=A0A8I1AC84_THEIN|nr:sigma 54-interacting transcriptional regulator [Thermoactinomyces intermedius]MBA4548318.1 sigma 54-interacting transcriptional regulator [Thermoactinomyces intermedius]MBA4837453.1 sigma 54-interacting transcriptional regulator [Thermoactinomyces intermedius]MBH8595162.1 sigma 54-interacting transcriptional regulator [Thermoactinomyces intermedius]
MKTIALCIKTIDRVGMTHEVISCLLADHVDIERMEVESGSIHLKIRSVPSGVFKKLTERIRQIPGVKELEPVQILPSEMREGQMNTILETVSEGMILVDARLKIQAMNRATAEILRLFPGDWEEEDLPGLWGTDPECLRTYLQSGKEQMNVPVTICRGPDMIQVLASFIPVRSGGKRQSGLVIVIRDMNQVRQLLRSVNRKGMVQFQDIIHQSETMKRCVETAKKVAQMEATVLLQGESGTGKELFARAIHFESRRANGPFISINCAAVPESLMESEWFGYEEGAFTGAGKGGKKGLMELAQDGTLFLDEIGELPLNLQAKLLRVLEERALRRVGGNRWIPLRVRIIAATNRDLADLVRRGRFRKDLYYRLHVIPVTIPPLRERREDIPLLATHFLRKFCARSRRPLLSLSSQSLLRLQAHSWPGNVRELQNVMERSVYLCPEGETELKEVYLSDVLDTDFAFPRRSLKEHLAQYEKELVQAGIRRFKSIRKTARHLGVSHTTVLNKMKKYGISKKDIFC